MNYLQNVAGSSLALMCSVVMLCTPSGFTLRGKSIRLFHAASILRLVTYWALSYKGCLIQVKIRLTLSYVTWMCFNQLSAIRTLGWAHAFVGMLWSFNLVWPPQRKPINLWRTLFQANSFPTKHFWSPKLFSVVAGIQTRNLTCHECISKIWSYYIKRDITTSMPLHGSTLDPWPG